MGAVAEGRLDPASDAFQSHIDRCLGCRACETVCPSGVPYGQLLETARSAAVAARPTPGLTRSLLAVFGSDRLRHLAMVLSRGTRATGLPALAARLLPATGILGRAKLASAMLAASAPARGLGGADTPGLAPKADDPHRDRGPGCVVLTGCVQEGLFARVNRATERTLKANGCSLYEADAQGCCGALHAHAGHLDEARRLARRNVDALHPLLSSGQAELVVVNAAGCGAAMRDYAHLLQDDPDYAPRAQEVAGAVRDVSEVLAERGPRPGAPLPLRVAYDAPCHLQHAQRVVDAPLAVLDAVPGLERIPLAGSDECCGGAGIYGITHPELGGQIGGDKVSAVQASGAEVLATGNPGCMMQIGAGLRMAGAQVQVAHPVELLDHSYRAAGLYDT